MTRRAMSPGTAVFGRPCSLRNAGLAVLVCVASLSSVLALPIQEGRMVSFDVQGEKVSGFFVRPATVNFYPGVVVIHEWWGLNDQIKRVANRLAGEGYVVIVPDLYRGKLGTDAGWAHLLSRGLNEDWAVDVIGTAADWLRAMGTREAPRPRHQRMPVATLGFSMGGRLSLATALKRKNIQAAVMFCGSVETNMEALQPLSVPLLGIFGGDDRAIPKDQVRAFEAALQSAGKDATIIIYAGVGQSFFNEFRPNYEKSAAEVAWGRTTQFLKEKLSEAAVVAPKGQNQPPAGSPAKDDKEPSEG